MQCITWMFTKKKERKIPKLYYKNAVLYIFGQFSPFAAVSLFVYIKSIMMSYYTSRSVISIIIINYVKMYYYI